MVICAVALLLSCTKAPEIELRGPEKPQPPVADTTTPSSNEEGGPGTPSPTPIPVTRYRALCDDRYAIDLTAISSMASASGFGSDLQLQVWPENQPLPTQGVFAPEDRNLEDHLFPQVIKLLGGSVIRFAYSAKPKNQDPSLSPAGVYKRNVYISEMSMIDRVGRAVFMAEEMPTESSAVSFSNEHGFQARTFGVSVNGKLLLVLDGKGVRFIDAFTLQDLGRVELKGASNYFLPQYRSSDRLLVVSKMKSGYIQSETFNIEFKVSGEVHKTKPVFTISDLRRPLAFVGTGAGEFISGMKSNSAGNSEIVLVDLKGASGQPVVTSFQLKSLPLKGKVASSLAVWKDGLSNELRAAIGFEQLSLIGSGFSTRLKVNQAFVRLLKLDVGIGAATPVGSDFEYPSEAIRTIESGSTSARMTGVKDLVVSPDGKAVFALFPGLLSFQVFRLNSSGFDRMSQEECTNLSIGVEP